MRLYLPALFLLLLSACAPAPQIQGVVAVPVVASSAPDLSGTRAVLDAAIASTAEASRVAVAGTAEARAVASAQAQGTVEARVWGMTAQALEIQADGATATERARGTATALAWPAVSAARQEIERRNTLAEERARWSLRLEPWKQGAAIALQYLLLALLGWLLFTGINHLVPALADRVRGAEVITAYQISEPRPVPLLAGPGNGKTTIYTGEPGAVSAMRQVDLPCSVEDMTLVSYYVVVRRDFSLAVNRWEERGLSGRIDEIRAWFLDQEYADEDTNKRVTVNRAGVEFCGAWWREHSAALPHPRESAAMGA